MTSLYNFNIVWMICYIWCIICFLVSQTKLQNYNKGHIERNSLETIPSNGIACRHFKVLVRSCYSCDFCGGNSSSCMTIYTFRLILIFWIFWFIFIVLMVIIKQLEFPKVCFWDNGVLFIIYYSVCHVRSQNLYSLSGKTSYRKISWSLEAARFRFRLF